MNKNGENSTSGLCIYVNMINGLLSSRYINMSITFSDYKKITVGSHEEFYPTTEIRISLIVQFKPASYQLSGFRLNYLRSFFNFTITIAKFGSCFYLGGSTNYWPLSQFAV